MVKVEGKKTAVAAKKSAKSAARPAVKKAAAKKPAPKPPAAKKPAAKKPAAKKPAAKKPAAKKPAAKKPAAKKPAAKKPAAKKASPKAAALKKAAPKKAAPKPAPRAKAVAKKPAAHAKPAVKEAAKTAAAVAPATAKTHHAAAPSRPPAPPKAPREEKKRTRRARTKVTSSGPATAAWFVQGGPRSSSFIPAPARAEAPSLVAAPPASSDRLVAEHELTHFAVRTVPMRVDVEAAGGRVYLNVNPSEVSLKVGEGIEWDFRYLGGADIIIDELIVEFDKPSPFGETMFRSRRPGAARPHRQLSGAALKNAVGKRVQYTIRALNGFKTELASSRPWVTVT